MSFPSLPELFGHSCGNKRPVKEVWRGKLFRARHRSVTSNRLSGPGGLTSASCDREFLLSEVLPVVTIDDGAEKLCALPKRESNSEASKDRTTNMQGLLLQGL